ncbi:hypothetical protein EDF83_0622 [Pseudomonas protegens]|uniref:hypothetical protein n=1 Tax=Pseudomonas TaxID=286 RepID=UPI000F4A0D38|nr:MULTISPECIES: hypothetical protein [Pseudomonas]MCS4261072.1 hypothetical protein [Pseudomonas sp. BIGb0176]ROQ61365.1 hypothetical protein EDF83_0622 [Pseudomonas protegens]ROQ83684.1 hypothetical protein EC837_0539 [Pseudomonas protegens]
MPMLDTKRLEFEKLPPLTDAQVQAGAQPGENWDQAWSWACPPYQVDTRPGADYTLAGPLGECEGEPLSWETAGRE